MMKRTLRKLLFSDESSLPAHPGTEVGQGQGASNRLVCTLSRLRERFYSIRSLPPREHRVVLALVRN